jgi:hypothetical protein
MSTDGGGARSLLATIVGYVIIAVVALVLFRFIAGTIFWAIRAVVIIVILLGLVTIYAKLKSPD